MPDIIVIGAGAAGLAAARQLAKAGRTVTVLEARNRIGGRIHTLREAGFSVPAEAGAEFVHGDLPLTLQLLREAGIVYTEMEGQTWQVTDGQVQPGGNFPADWPLLLAKLRELDHDVSIAQFLEVALGGQQYEQLRESVRRYAEGYDAADTHKASALALRAEWTSEDDAPQYRLPDGYGRLMDFLAGECATAGCRVHLSAPVTEIRWAPGRVDVGTESGGRLEAKMALITVPLGVWQAEAIAFSPPLSAKTAAARAMGFGAVIKILLEFTEAFWEKPLPAQAGGRQLPGLGFLFSDASVPTWWTRLPDITPVLTGWLAGPAAQICRSLPDQALLDMALDSLSSVLLTDKNELRRRLTAYRVINWPADPFSLGAYSYATVGDASARETLARRVGDTLFFAGEALHQGPAIGTVEAALASGTQTAQTMLALGSRGV